MKKLLFLIMLLSVTAANAQVEMLDKYPIIPIEYDAAFIDQVKDNKAGVANTEHGEYFGQITEEQSIYGFGAFFTKDEGVVYGQYRNGQFIFGIKMGDVTAIIGTNSHYVCYDLTTGEPLYIFKNGKKHNVSKDLKQNNQFVTLTYGNGDKYVGETVNGKREGYGLYFYNNGNYSYGKYANNHRKGFGATFHTTNNIYVAFFDENE